MTVTVEVSTDAELVHAARRHENGAFGELFRRWYDRSYDIALNILRDPEAAADVAQDAFLVGWERLAELRDPHAFGGWILRITRNRALNRVARDRLRAMEPIEPHGERPAVPDPDADPALHLERSDRCRLIWTAVAVLGERDTSLLDLHLRHGLEPAEIAEELRITPNNASQLLFRLRRKLREAIGAVLLWRNGRPSCPNLASLLAESGSFDTQVAAMIKRHQRDCNQCLREISRQTHPEWLFAAVPFALAPLLLKDRAAAALVQAGAPLTPSTVVGSAPAVMSGPSQGAGPAPGVTSGPSQGAGPAPGVTSGPSQGVGLAPAVVALAVVALAVLSAVVLWPRESGGEPSAAGERSIPVTSSTGVPTEAAVVGGGTSPSGLATEPATGAPIAVPETVSATAPVMSTTAPDAAISHAPRKSWPAIATPTGDPTPTGNPTSSAPGGGPPSDWLPGLPPLPPGRGGGGCPHHHWPGPGW
jgi:RNA polymerase sigma factor (sigma-70 family)